METIAQSRVYMRLASDHFPKSFTNHLHKTQTNSAHESAAGKAGLVHDAQELVAPWETMLKSWAVSVLIQYW